MDAIGRARIPYALLTLGELIAETDAPEDHTAIYAAFQEKAIELGVTNSEGFTQIIHSMAEQGEEAKEKEKEKEGA